METKTRKTGALLKRFVPYYRSYVGITDPGPLLRSAYDSM